MTAIKRLKPASRSEWLDLHDDVVSGSRIGVLVDDDYPFVTRYEYWQEKSGRIQPDHEDSPAKRRGRLMEAVAADIAAEEIAPATLTRNELDFWLDDSLRVGTTPDALVQHPERGPGIIELKNPTPEEFAKHWPLVDGLRVPPLWIACQAITQAQMTGAQWAAIGVMRVHWRVEFDLIEIPLNTTAWPAMCDAVGAFWRSVETDTPPQPDYKRDLAVIKALHPHSLPTTLDLSHDAELKEKLAEREASKKLISQINAMVDEIDAEIRHKAGDAEAFTAGPYRVSLKTQQINGYSVKPRTQRPIRITNLAKAKS